jgi:hypothetical protein
MKYGRPWGVHARNNVTNLGFKPRRASARRYTKDDCDVRWVNLDLVNKSADDPNVLWSSLHRSVCFARAYRPQTGYYAELIEEAAAISESVAQNHRFIDGNGRKVFAATYTFLAIDGARLAADADKLAPWLRSHVTQAS